MKKLICLIALTSLLVFIPINAIAASTHVTGITGTSFVTATITSLAGTSSVNVESVDGTTFTDLKLIDGTNPAYHSTVNANSYFFAGTTGATFAEFAVKTTPGAIKSIHCGGQVNDEASYVTLYDLAAGPVTVGTTQPSVQFLCNSGSTGGALGATSYNFGEGGLRFGTAITGAVCKVAGCGTDVDVAVPLVIEYK